MINESNDQRGNHQRGNHQIGNNQRGNNQNGNDQRGNHQRGNDQREQRSKRQSSNRQSSKRQQSKRQSSMPPVQSARPYDQNRSIDDRLIDFQLWRKSFSGSQAMTPVTTRLSLGCCNVAHLSGSICMFSFLPRFPALGEVFLCKPVDRTSHPLRLWFNRGCFLLPRSHHCGSPPKFKA